MLAFSEVADLIGGWLVGKLADMASSLWQGKRRRLAFNEAADLIGGGSLENWRFSV